MEHTFYPIKVLALREQWRYVGGPTRALGCLCLLVFLVDAAMFFLGAGSGSIIFPAAALVIGGTRYIARMPLRDKGDRDMIDRYLSAKGFVASGSGWASRSLLGFRQYIHCEGGALFGPQTTLVVLRRVLRGAA